MSVHVQVAARCLRRKQQTVGKIEAVKALCINRIQQDSNTGRQLIQQESLRNTKILQVSISSEIWFGTRGSEVQILSPRPSIPLIKKHYEIRPPAPVRAHGYSLGPISVSTATTRVPPRAGARPARPSHTVRTPGVGPSARVGAG